MFSRAVIYLSLIYCIILEVESQCCLQFASNLCIKCPQNMHLYRSNCIFDLPGCIQYSQGFDCSKCNPSFQLANGTCFHPRFNLSLQNINNFTVYLQSAVKPNPLLSSTLSQLSSNSLLWQSWLKQSALNNRTIMSGTILNKHSNSLQNRIVGSSGNQPHYIYTTNYMLNSKDLTIFRLTYRVIAPYGFADVYIAIESETNSNSIIYLQIFSVNFTELGSSGWSIVDPKTDSKFSNLLNQFFSTMSQQYFLQGYWKEVEQEYNVTLLYMNGQKGVISYNYIIATEDLTAMNITLIPDSQNAEVSNNNTQANNPQINVKNHSSNSATENSSKTTPNPKPNDTTTSKPSDNTSNPVTPNPSSQQQVTPNASNSKQSANQTQTTSAKTPSNSSTKQLAETLLPLTEIQTNPIVATGYAVAIQQNYVPPNSTLEAISLFSLNNTYCIYFQMMTSPKVYYKLIFYVNAVISQFEIIYFVSSTQSLLPAKFETPNNTNTNTNSNTNSSIHTDTATNTPPKNTTKNTTKTNNSTVVPIITNNSNQPKFSGYINSSLIEFCPQLSQFVSIDITGQLAADLFLPKITLLIHKMYGQSLLNCELADAKYSWLLDSKTVVNKIIYNITYASTHGELYQFDVLIANNVLSFIKVPNNFKENGVITTSNNKINANATTTTTINATSTPNINTPTDVTPNIITNPINPTNLTNTTSPTNASNSTSVNSSKTIANDTVNTDATTNISGSNSADLSHQNAAINIVIVDNTKHILNSSKINVTAQTNASNQNTTKQNKILINNSINNSPPPSPTTNIPNNTQANKSNSTNTNDGNFNFTRTEVPPSSYTTLPQYKSIVQIVRSIKRVPSNSTVLKFTEWNQKNQLYYQLTFTMTYLKPLNDGSAIKLFIYNVNVNSSSYVTIVNSTYCYKSINNTIISPPPLGPSTPSNILKTSGITQKSSPYTPYLSSILMKHSPGLMGSSAVMLDYQILGSDFGGMRTHYSETLRLSTNTNATCFQVFYDVTSMIGAPGGKDYVHVKQYQFTNCSEQTSNQFLYRLTSIRFSDNSIYNRVINSMIFNISDQRTTQFLHYEQFLNFYKIQFLGAGRGDTQALIDGDKKILLFFLQKSKIVYTPSENQLTDTAISYMQKQISINLNLKNTSFEIFYVQKIPLENSFYWALNVFGCSTTTVWGLQLRKYYNVQLFFNESLHQTIIYNQTQLTIKQDNAFVLQFKGIEGWIAIQIEILLDNPQFADIMNKLFTTYNTFMQNCQIQFVLTPTAQQKQQYFNLSYNAQITLKVLLAKQYTPDYFGNFAITITYVPTTSVMTIKSVQVVPPNSISVLYCQVHEPPAQSLPVCALCQKGYQKVNGICIKIVPGCIQYYDQLCLRCKYGYQTDAFTRCEDINSIETDILTILNAYILENQ